MILYVVRKDVEFINETSNVAIVTLWTRKETVLNKLKASGVAMKVHAVGTLYTAYGINYLLHTLAERPQINTLLVFGADLSESGEALIELFRDRNPPPGLKLLWTFEQLKPLLETVRIVDLRDSFRRGEWRVLLEAIERYYDTSPTFRKPLTLELRETPVEGWPMPVSGQVVSEESLLRAWVKAVYAVLSLGIVKDSEYGERQKQLLNLVTVFNVYGREIVLEPELLRYFPEKDFTSHFNSLLEPRKPEGVSYTYGERLRSHPHANDQLTELIHKLKEFPETRRAVVVLWSHGEDSHSREPPCIIVIQGDISQGYYNHTVYLRSNDVYTAWPLNAWGQLKLAELIAKRLQLETGVVTLISCSAHIYEHDWARAWDLVHEHYPALSTFTRDPRGDFLISVQDKKLDIEHRTPKGSLSTKFTVESYDDLKPLASLLTPEHAFYLGWEARRALEKALKGEHYVQDKD